MASTTSTTRASTARRSLARWGRPVRCRVSSALSPSRRDSAPATAPKTGARGHVSHGCTRHSAYSVIELSTSAQAVTNSSPLTRVPVTRSQQGRTSRAGGAYGHPRRHWCPRYLRRASTGTRFGQWRRVRYRLRARIRDRHDALRRWQVRPVRRLLSQHPCLRRRRRRWCRRVGSSA